jgi:D-alanyl-D-alanine carboxypeptidase
MTAIVVLENLRLDDIITISKKAVMTEGENGSLVIDEKLSVRNLLYIMLIESSNDAAVALASAVSDDGDDFVSLMNKKTKEIGLENTYFIDSAGISRWNYSTIFDLTQLAKYSFNNKSLIWQIFGIKETEIYSRDRNISHHLVNTNELLGEALEMIGGKTGFTEEAGGCMLTIVKKPDKLGEYLITVVLGSENREIETKKLIEWALKAYVW